MNRFFCEIAQNVNEAQNVDFVYAKGSRLNKVMIGGLDIFEAFFSAIQGHKLAV